MGRVLLLFTVLCSVLLAETAVDIKKKKAVIRKLGNCRNAGNLPLIWSNFKIVTDEKTGDSLLGIKATVKSEISEDLSIVFNFMKCDASGNPDSCEYVLKDYNVKNICTYMVAKNEAWSPFIEKFDKPLKCPIAPDVYSISEFPITTDFLNYLPVSDGQWIVKFEGSDKGKRVSCVELIMQIVPHLVKRQ